MKITDELIEYIGELSRLELSDDEKEARKTDLTNILDYMDKLNNLDTDGVPEMTHPFNKVNIFREDIVTNEDRREELLRNAPDRKDDFFKVFKTVEE
jgi:aspartyl-tRNA(Asn)/glutamyl-tRNA(Gln) amidotransferase subunit C